MLGANDFAGLKLVPNISVAAGAQQKIIFRRSMPAAKIQRVLSSDVVLVFSRQQRETNSVCGGTPFAFSEVFDVIWLYFAWRCLKLSLSFLRFLEPSRSDDCFLEQSKARSYIRFCSRSLCMMLTLCC